jgi:hypothetical protein
MIGNYLHGADPDGSDLRDSTMLRKKEKAQPDSHQTVGRRIVSIRRLAGRQSYPL